MGIEAQCETGLKRAFQAYTDTLDPAEAVTYRCFFLDDEVESGEPNEKRQYPLIEITARPNVPRGHKSIFRDCSVRLKWATHRNTDPKKALLVKLYEGCRAIIDAETTITVTGHTVQGAVIMDETDSDVDENEQYISMVLNMRLCGA